VTVAEETIRCDGRGAAFGYSLGRNRTDVYPEQRIVNYFDELQDAILAARHVKRKEDAPYFARPFGLNEEGRSQRLQQHALACSWVALDADYLTPAAHALMITRLSRWRGFWYLTMTATADNLKCRIVLECDRLVETAEHARVVGSVESWLLNVLGVTGNHAAFFHPS
jgi:hypothetical protein